MSPVHIKTRTTKKGDRRYLCYYRMGGGREAKTLYAGSFHKKAEAQARRDLIAGELAAGRDPRILLARLNEPPVAPLGLLERWDSFMASRIDVGVKAQRQYRNARDRWLPILGSDRDPASITADDVIAGIADLFDECACLAFDADSDENGWRPCPANLCERDDHQHHPDWLVSFARKVAYEHATSTKHRVFCVMLNEREADGLLTHIMELVGDA